jgi:hypothetical protein
VVQSDNATEPDADLVHPVGVGAGLLQVIAVVELVRAGLAVSLEALLLIFAWVTFVQRRGLARERRSHEALRKGGGAARTCLAGAAVRRRRFRLRLRPVAGNGQVRAHGVRRARVRAIGAPRGSGRIVVSEKEAPKLSATLV